MNERINGVISDYGSCYEDNNNGCDREICGERSGQGIPFLRHDFWDKTEELKSWLQDKGRVSQQEKLRIKCWNYKTLRT